MEGTSRRRGNGVLRLRPPWSISHSLCDCFQATPQTQKPDRNRNAAGRSRLVAPRIRKGGLFVTDNTLWSGKVAEAALHERPGNGVDDRTKAIVEFNRALYESKEFFTTIIPLRDGVSVAMKL